MSALRSTTLTITILKIILKQKKLLARKGLEKGKKPEKRTWDPKIVDVDEVTYVLFSCLLKSFHTSCTLVGTTSTKALAAGITSAPIPEVPLLLHWRVSKLT
ncbi:hypothetical protein Ancab_029890, partial [Ancistrocladus abbreviatus]